ncbi:MAG: IS110 family transposase, partial [Pontiellaceae bacterium]|nr:IS110 family transposase [Pontiellaceae bacterium]MBN2786331.1 IS110 family transposase [Pontiellaceae bacterium]
MDALNPLSELLKAHSDFHDKFRRLVAVKSIGTVSAMNLLAYLPELGLITDHQAAALAGLAPYNKDSGNQKGQRMVQGGRPRIRRALYMSAMTGSFHNPAFMGKRSAEHLLSGAGLSRRFCKGRRSVSMTS